MDSYKRLRNKVNKLHQIRKREYFSNKISSINGDMKEITMSTVEIEIYFENRIIWNRVAVPMEPLQVHSRGSARSIRTHNVPVSLDTGPLDAQPNLMKKGQIFQFFLLSINVNSEFNVVLQISFFPTFRMT